MGEPATIRKALQRLTDEGLLIRVFMGIYSYPKIDTELGLGVLSPSMDDIAKAIARRDNLQIMPNADYALNGLGLSTQVPVNAVYLTNGSSRRVKVGNGRGILFQHTSDNTLFAYKSPLMYLIVIAMKAIGEEHLTADEWETLKQHLSKVSASHLQHDIKLAPLWIQKKIHSI